MVSEMGGVALHLTMTPCLNESRLMRHARYTLSNGICREVVVAAAMSPGLARRESVSPGLIIERIAPPRQWLLVSKVRGVLRLLELVFGMIRIAVRCRPRIVVAHTLALLPVALLAARISGAQVVYDAHELETEKNGLSGARQKIARLTERVCIRHVAAVIVVGDAIAEWYRSAYPGLHPFVVRNVPEAVSAPARDGTSSLRNRLGLPGKASVFLYLGAFSHGRRIEQLLRVFSSVPNDRHLVLLGSGSLRDMIQSVAERHINIHCLDAVPSREVLAWASGADIGICGGENVCLSYFLSLPNKLFEYLHAGLPVLVPDWPEMGGVVERYRCGWTVGDADADWVQRIVAIDHRSARAMHAGVAVAAVAFSWEAEAEQLLAAYKAANPVLRAEA